MRKTPPSAVAGLATVSQLMYWQWELLQMPEVSVTILLLVAWTLYLLAIIMIVNEKGISRLWYVLGILGLLGFLLACLLPDHAKKVINLKGEVQSRPPNTHVRFRRAFYAIFFGILLLGTLIFLFDRIVVANFLENWLSNRIKPITNKTYTYLHEFNRDVEALRSKLLFLNSNNLRDAGPYLNPRVEWDSSEQDRNKVQEYLSRFDGSDKFILNEITKTLLAKNEIDFLKLDSKDFAQVNTEWLSKLDRYDHWNIDKNSPVDLFPRSSLTTPYPNFALDFLKIHLIKAKEKGHDEYVKAAREVLHYGQLCLSTETLVGAAAMVFTIKLIKAATVARPKIEKDMGPWALILDETARLKRVFFAVNQFARPTIGTNIETMKDVYRALNPSLGLCAAIREATIIDWPLWSAITDAFPVEFDEYRKLILNYPLGCRLTWLTEKTPPWEKLPGEPKSLYLSGQAFSLTSVAKDSIGIILVNNLARPIHYMPNTRRFVSTLVLSISNPGWTRGYEEQSSATNAASGSLLKDVDRTKSLKKE